MSSEAFTVKASHSAWPGFIYLDRMRLTMTGEDISAYRVQFNDAQSIHNASSGELTIVIPWEDLKGIHTIRIDNSPNDPAVRPVTYDVQMHRGEVADLSIESRTSAIVATGTGNDMVRTGQGNDLLVSGAGNDTLVAGSGDDTIDGDSGDDRISGGDGADEIYGGDGNDLIAGGAGNDWISDWTGMNTLRGGEG